MGFVGNKYDHDAIFRELSGGMKMNGRNVRTGGCVFAEYFTASGKLSFFMYSKEEFVKAINEDYKREYLLFCTRYGNGQEKLSSINVHVIEEELFGRTTDFEDYYRKGRIATIHRARENFNCISRTFFGQDKKNLFHL